MGHLLERQEDKWLIYAHPHWPPASSSNHGITTATISSAGGSFNWEGDSQSHWEIWGNTGSTMGSLINDSSSPWNSWAETSPLTNHRWPQHLKAQNLSLGVTKKIVPRTLMEANSFGFQAWQNSLPTFKRGWNTSESWEGIVPEKSYKDIFGWIPFSIMVAINVVSECVLTCRECARWSLSCTKSEGKQMWNQDPRGVFMSKLLLRGQKFKP